MNEGLTYPLPTGLGFVSPTKCAPRCRPPRRFHTDCPLRPHAEDFQGVLSHSHRTSRSRNRRFLASGFFLLADQTLLQVGERQATSSQAAVRPSGFGNILATELDFGGGSSIAESVDKLKVLR